jgi:hypothetical protein
MNSIVATTAPRPSGHSGGFPGAPGGGRPDPLQAEAGRLLKAVGSSQRRASGPKYVKHYVSDAVRRYTALSNGILDDQTPHLDALVLRALASRNVVLQVIIHTIINQVASHFVKPMTDKSIGVKIVQKDRKKSLTKAAANEAARIEDLLLNGGVVTEHPRTGEPGVWDSHGQETADDLETAVRKLIRDSLVLDRAYVVTEGSMSGREPVLYWKHVDGGLIRLVDSEYYLPEIRTGADGTDDLTGRVKYVQMAPDMDYKVDREYPWYEGYMSFRNPSPELLSFGLGKSEVEECLGALTGILYTMQANQDWFTRNHVPQGLVTVFGNFQREDIDDLQSMLAGDIGVGGSIWEVPVLAAQPMQGNAVTWTPFVDRSRMDMVSKTYLELCIALCCGVFQIAPEECGFHSFGGPSSTIGGDGGQEEKLQHSQHKGLLPKVLWLKKFFSKAIVERINPDFELVIQGLDAVYNPEQLLKAQLDIALMTNGLTMNQIAARNDEPPVVDPIDEELWDEIREAHEEQWYATERERTEAMVAEYKAQGGKLGNYPNAPVNNMGAMQIWMAEHLQEGQDTKSEMGQMAQGEQAFQQQDEQMEKQGAMQGMDAGVQQEQEFQQGDRQADADAARAGELRIPQMPNALSGVRKALRVYRIGPRDE